MFLTERFHWSCLPWSQKRLGCGAKNRNRQRQILRTSRGLGSLWNALGIFQVQTLKVVPWYRGLKAKGLTASVRKLPAIAWCQVSSTVKSVDLWSWENMQKAPDAVRCCDAARLVVLSRVVPPSWWVWYLTEVTLGTILELSWNYLGTIFPCEGKL